MCQFVSTSELHYVSSENKEYNLPAAVVVAGNVVELHLVGLHSGNSVAVAQLLEAKQLLYHSVAAAVAKISIIIKLY